MAPQKPDMCYRLLEAHRSTLQYFLGRRIRCKLWHSPHRQPWIGLIRGAESAYCWPIEQNSSSWWPPISWRQCQGDWQQEHELHCHAGKLAQIRWERVGAGPHMNLVHHPRPPRYLGPQILDTVQLIPLLTKARHLVLAHPSVLVMTRESDLWSGKHGNEGSLVLRRNVRESHALGQEVGETTRIEEWKRPSAGLSMCRTSMRY